MRRVPRRRDDANRSPEGAEITRATHHDVWQVPTLDALESCDLSGATMLADRPDGGGCEDETDAACMSAATAFELRTPTAGDMYLVCSVGDHCANGQRLTVSVVDELVVPTPRVIDVPYWTDDYGYCKPLPGYDAGVHRPSGLDPIGAQVGHNVLHELPRFFLNY